MYRQMRLVKTLRRCADSCCLKQYKIHNRIRKYSDHQANDCVHYGIFGSSHLVAITVRDGVADTTDDDHDDRDDTDCP